MKACQHCINPAFVRCRTHRQVICGSEYCLSRHRDRFTVAHHSESYRELAGLPSGCGDCEFVAAGLHGWRLELVRWTVAIGVGCLITLLVAL